MNRLKILFLAISLFTTVLISCNKDEEDAKPQLNATKIAYVVNYGTYGGSKSDISIYDIKTGTITNGAYKTANNVEFTSNIQSMYIYKDIAYFMSNNGDKIDIVDAKTLKASVNPVSSNIVKPRYMAAKDNFVYISCWGDVKDWSKFETSYIAKMNLTTKEVSKITLPGGTEGVAIIGNKLYTALTATNKVAVIDLTTEAISYITVDAIPQHFVTDAEGNLWVSLVSTYSAPFAADKLGLAVIDTKTNTVAGKVNFTGIGSDGYIRISGDKKTVYVMGSEPWPGKKATIFSVNTTAKTLSASALIEGESFYGFNVNPENDDIYVLISPSATTAGSLKIYNKSGNLLDEETTGVGPNHVVFYSISAK